MLKARSLKPAKYHAGEWSQRNMKWTRAEDWAAWERTKAEEKQKPNGSGFEDIDPQMATGNDCEGIDKQSPLGVHRDQVEKESDSMQVCDASA